MDLGSYGVAELGGTEMQTSGGLRFIVINLDPILSEPVYIPIPF